MGCRREAQSRLTGIMSLRSSIEEMASMWRSRGAGWAEPRGQAMHRGPAGLKSSTVVALTTSLLQPEHNTPWRKWHETDKGRVTEGAFCYV